MRLSFHCPNKSCESQLCSRVHGMVVVKKGQPKGIFNFLQDEKLVHSTSWVDIQVIVQETINVCFPAKWKPVLQLMTTINLHQKTPQREFLRTHKVSKNDSSRSRMKSISVSCNMLVTIIQHLKTFKPPRASTFYASSPLWMAIKCLPPTDISRTCK